MELSDTRTARPYICIVQSSVLGKLVQGDDQIVVPCHGSGIVEQVVPALMWSSPQTVVVLMGETAKLKCIFSGFPTPRVSWRQVDGAGELPVKATVQSFGQELMITDVDTSVVGTYECSALNSLVQSREPVSTEFQLVFESVLYLLAPLENMNTLKDTNVTFICMAAGVPQPTVTW